MFRTRPRPSPSPSTLRALYQLGYILSGTAVGLATLCVEEQRRRIKILQRIADNAKIIRQSSRYKYSVASAAHTPSDVDTGAFFGNEQTSRAQRRARRRVERQHQVTLSSSDDTVGKDSGSLQDAQLAAQEIGQRTVASEAQGSRDDDYREASRVAAEQEHIVHRTLKRTHDGSLKGLSRRLSPLKDIEANEHRGSLGMSHFVDIKQDAGKRNASPTDSFVVRFVGHTLDDPITRLPQRMHIGYAHNVELSTEAITSDVNLFFHCVAESIRLGRSCEQFEEPANNLFAGALRFGKLVDIRSLLLWMSDQGMFSHANAKQIFDAEDTLASRMDHQELFDFYENLSASEYFQSKLDLKLRLQLAMKLAGRALRWNLDVPLSSRVSALLPLDLGPQPDILLSALRDECLEMICADRCIEAAELFLQTTQRSSDRKTFASVASEVFAAALERRQLAVCAKLLRWKQENLPHKKLKDDADDMIKICSQQNADALLIDLFLKKELPALFLRRISITSRVILAKLCEADQSQRGNFERLCQVLPVRERLALTDRSMTTDIKTLWETTRNLKAVEEKLPQLVTRLKKGGKDEDLRWLDETLASIYIKANKPDQALGPISRLHKTQEASSVTICLAALVCAKRNAWTALSRLVEIAKESKSLRFDGKTTKLFNQVIHAFSLQHSASDTERFVVNAIHDLGFLPSRTTSDIVLQCFVTNHEFERIPKWLKFLRGHGQHFELDARVAVNLMTTYYLQHRRSHVQIMWFCSRFMEISPSFAPKHFFDLIKEAIGYDVRVKRWTPQFAGLQLARLASTPHLLAPYKRADEQYLPIYDVPRALSLSTSEPRISPIRSLRDNVLRNTSLEHLADEGTSPIENEEIQNTDVEDKGTVTPAELQKASYSTDHVSQAAQDNGILVARSTALAASDRLEIAWNSDHLPTDSPSAVDSAQQQQETGNSTPEYEDCSTALSFKEFHDNADEERVRANTYESQVPDTPEEQTPFLPPTEDGQFSQLRLLYQYPGIAEEDNLSQRYDEKQRSTERNMILALSLRRYQQVFDLYHQTLDKAGLPLSPIALEVAVEASLRLNNGETEHAQGIMSRAKDAGMNVACAMGPLLIRQIKRLEPDDLVDVNRLRTTVIDYYRTNDANGWPVTHHVGNTAANTLITKGRPEHGLNILMTIHRSEWAKERPTDIADMTVLLKGYLAVQAISGVRWVVRNVLEKNIRIDPGFMRQLMRALKGDFGRRNVSQKGTLRVPPELRFFISRWGDLCYERYQQQRHDSNKAGWRLTRTITNVVRRAGEEESYKSTYGATRRSRMRRHLQATGRRGNTNISPEPEHHARWALQPKPASSDEPGQAKYSPF